MLRTVLVATAEITSLATFGTMVAIWADPRAGRLTPLSTGKARDRTLLARRDSGWDPRYAMVWKGCESH
jgi:hypothetical protein